jgi:eukaryotic-like serine/threonine-protein kinase
MAATELDCPDENLLVAFTAGLVRGADAAAIEGHMDTCRECRLVLAHLARSSPVERTWADSRSDLLADGSVDEYAVGQVLADRFCLLGRVGTGGMGQVYEAEDLLLGIRVAIKLLPPQVGASRMFVTQLYQELLLGRRVGHPNVCRIYDLGKSGDVYFLTMELLDGDTLAARLARGPLPYLEACQIVEQMVAALAAAHREGVVHRDFKPANIMLSRRGLVKVMDFGLARDHRCRPSGGLTAVGTPAYWAPEQARGDLATAASDVYALGLVMAEVLSGPRRDAGPPVELSAIRQPFRSVIARCLAERPGDRFASAVEVETALRRLARSHMRRRAHMVSIVPAGIALAIAAFALWGRFAASDAPAAPTGMATAAAPAAHVAAPPIAQAPVVQVAPLPLTPEERAAEARPRRSRPR